MAVTINGGAPSAPQITEFQSVFQLMSISMAALSVRANATNATANGTDVAAGSDGHVLRRSGTTLGFGTVATAGIADAAITLAKMANLAQDQVIGRVTASTGVPETFTVTAAARSVLDDATVAAMVDTLGGAASSGTGGIARVNSPTFVTPALGTPSAINLANATFPAAIATLTGSQMLTNKTITAPIVDGVATYSGASNFTETSLGDFVAHTDAGAQLTSTMTADATLTFDATPADTRVFGPVRVPANSGGPYTLTIPSSVNTATGATITTVSVPASGQVELTFRRIGSTNYVYGVPGSGSGTVTSVAASVPTGLTISGSPVTTSGTLAIALDTGYVIPTQAALDAKQPLDSDLTTIAGLTATTDNFIQSKAGAWASRTVAQVAADLNGTGLGATNLAFRHIPQNSQSAAYTAVAADAGGHILHPTADNNARTFTIPANASVAYPIGTAITFVNLINTVTIAITTDTMILAGAGTTGSRTLAANGVATAIKITSTSWMISGTGLT